MKEWKIVLSDEKFVLLRQRNEKRKYTVLSGLKESEKRWAVERKGGLGKPKDQVSLLYWKSQGDRNVIHDGVRK